MAIFQQQTLRVLEASSRKELNRISKILPTWRGIVKRFAKVLHNHLVTIKCQKRVDDLYSEINLMFASIFFHFQSFMWVMGTCQLCIPKHQWKSKKEKLGEFMKDSPPSSSGCPFSDFDRYDVVDPLWFVKEVLPLINQMKIYFPFDPKLFRNCSHITCSTLFMTSK